MTHDSLGFFPTDRSRSHRWLVSIPRLVRWNGLPGTVAFGTLEGQLMEYAEKILWAREPKTTVMALVPAASGGGRILFSQLDLQRHVDRASSGCDPAAERVLLQLLGWTSLKRR